MYPIYDGVCIRPECCLMGSPECEYTCSLQGTLQPLLTYLGDSYGASFPVSNHDLFDGLYLKHLLVNRKLYSSCARAFLVGGLTYNRHRS